MRLFIAQINPTVGAISSNAQKIVEVLTKARAACADLVLFPELALCGYPPEDLLLQSCFIDAQERSLQTVIAASSGLMVVVGMARRSALGSEKPIYNSAAVIQDGVLVGFADKCLLPTYDVFDERRYFEPGGIPQLWTYKGKKIGVLICEDIWQHAGCVGDTQYVRDPVLDLLPLKPDVVLNLSASPYHFQKPDVRIQVGAACARTLHCPVVLCCQVGGNDQLVFDGYSLVIGAKGEVWQMARGFVEDALLFDLSAPPSIPVTFSYDPLADLYQALVLGVKDYFHKLRFTKACLGLSGGIDSALVACIAVAALGKENVLGLGLPSCYSSLDSLIDARALAHALGIEWKEISIEPLFEDVLDLLAPEFEGRAFDVTEENLQARIRGMILMAISNKLGYIVLSTGNKSEMGLGYCTLYGDMCGGLSVISDVTKQQVYALCRWINQHQKTIPENIFTKPPSAELRPHQKDTDSLPEYDVIDKVLEGYIEESLSSQEIASKYHLALPLVIDLIERIHRAEYKRRQAAPGIRVSKKAFLVGRRYPIVQGWQSSH